jgi:glutamyl-tRNA synthetase
LDYYFAEGYPVPSVMEYLMTLLNSNFEEWRLANPAAPFGDFKFTTNKMSVSARSLISTSSATSPAMSSP